MGKDGINATQITLPFLHDVKTNWTLSDLDITAPNDKPNFNLTVMALILAANIEVTVGSHAWSQVESTLDRIGFTDMRHRFFEITERINHPAMVFARSKEKVQGKTVVAAIFRGSSSYVDFISDAKSQLDQIRDHEAFGGFYNAGVNSTNELKAYLNSQGLKKEETILFITGHSYGAVVASLVGIMSTELAERDSIFDYSFATPNYNRVGMTGEGMKMFSFNSNEDVVPQVPIGPHMDKTGVSIWYDRKDMQLNDPERYARFCRLYSYFRGGNDYDADQDFMPPTYSFKAAQRKPVNSVIVRNHMPYTYMAFILSELPDEEAYAYLAEENK